MFCTTITNVKKYRVDQLLPQVVLQVFSFVLPRSYIAAGQFSPVERTKIKMKPMWKTLKFLYCGSMLYRVNESSDSVTFWNRDTPSTENMKKISINSAVTLSRDETDIWMVINRACRPSFLPASLSTRDTLSTLNTRASCGATDSALSF